MEAIITQIISAISPAALPIVVCVLGLAWIYFKIQTQRKLTGKKRDEDTETLNTRITLLEHDCDLVKSQMETVSTKLDKICDLLTSIQIELAKKADKN